MNHKTIDEFVVSVGERLDIAYQSSVGVFCEGVGPVQTCTKIESLLEKISGDELKFLIRFDQPSSSEGIFYIPVIKPKKCRESPRFSHKKFFHSSTLAITSEYVPITVFAYCVGTFYSIYTIST